MRIERHACFVAALAALVVVPTARAGSFRSSDSRLNRIWAASVKTAEDMLAPGGQSLDALGRPCPEPAGMTVILDGRARDRCSYIGDESVVDLTYDSADPHFGVQRDMLELFAANQHGDGAIPSSPLYGYGIVLFDYCGYWATVLHNYVLYSGDLATARHLWPNLVRLLDLWYPAQTGPDGLLVNELGHMDYGYIRRQGTTVAYLNAQYVYVLKQAAELAGWLGHTDAKKAWLARAGAVSTAFQKFWDGAAGAFTDTTQDRVTHPQDGNAFAVLSGAAEGTQARSALMYLWTHDWRDYGNTISDSQIWTDADWGSDSEDRVYPFMSFYECLAWAKVGRVDALVDLVKREWGYMLDHHPGGTMWETIGPYGGPPTDQRPSWDAGWSSGAAPLLTAYVLGVRPTSPGYATFVVDPRPSGLAYASGTVTTPRGDIAVSWRYDARHRLVVTVKAPPGLVRVPG